MEAHCTDVSPLPGRRKEEVLHLKGSPFNREKMGVRQSPSWFCLKYCVPLQADHFPFQQGGCWLCAPEGCGLLQSWVHLHGSSSVLSQPGLRTCQGCLSATRGENLDSPSGNWTQPVLGPTLTLAPFITLLLAPPSSSTVRSRGRMLCYVQLG